MTNPNGPADNNNQPNNSDSGQPTPDFGSYRYPAGENEMPAQPSYPNYGSYETSGYGYAEADNSWAVDEKKNAVAPWALGVGILALLAGISVFLTAFAFLPALIALILGIIAVVKARQIDGPGRRMGMSVTSIILAVVAIILSILFFVIVFAVLSNSGVGDCFSITDVAEQQRCIENSLNEWLGSDVATS